MERIYVEVNSNDSEQVGSTSLVLSVQRAFGSESDVIVGYPGLVNEKCRLYTGDAILYQTPAGTFDIRVKTQNSHAVSFTVTQLSPNPSLGGAFISSDPSNTQFSELELNRIRASIEDVKSTLSKREDIAQEQLNLIGRKLDEIVEASSRLGRKDWINYAAGVLTSTCVSAAFTPGLTKTIFVTVNSAFGWLFGGTIYLLD